VQRWRKRGLQLLAALVLIAAGATALAVAALLAFTPLPLWLVLQGGRSTIDDHRHFLNQPIARATAASPLPASPAPLRWPGGLDVAAVEADLAARGTVALLVARRGQLVYERYFDGFAADQPAAVFSVAKSVVSLLLGLAIEDGHIAGVDEPVTRHLPELAAQDPGFAQVRLRHLLAMRSGIGFDEGYRSPTSDVARLYLGADLKAEVARLRIARVPNQIHQYQSGDTQLLGQVIERATGVPLARYAEQRLWQPLGAEFDASWSLDSAAGAQARAFCCLNARARDLLRLGLMVAADGQWNGRRIVGADWLRQSLAAMSGLPGPADPAWRNIERPHATEAAFYAWQWRVRPQPGVRPLQPGAMVYAQGLHGQILLIDRDSRTVVLRLGRRQSDRHWPTWMDELVRLNR
jgi:CubicO group peptidase (beta-lactamase class C family)